MTEILVDTSGSGGPVSVFSGADEQFVVAWTSVGVITCAPFSAAGVKLGDTFTVNGPDAPATWPVLAMTARGFVVAWVSGGDLLLQNMAADGTRVGGRIQANPTGVPVDPTSPPAVARLLDGAVVVCWADATLDTVRGQVFRGDLSRFGGPFVVNVPVDGDFGVTGSTVPHGQVNHLPTVAGLAVGDTGYAFVVAWQRGSSLQFTAAHHRFFSPAPGLPPSADNPAPSDEFMAKYDLLCRPNALSAVPGGGFCALRLASAGMHQNNVLMADLYNSTGGFLSSNNITHVADNTTSTAPMIFPTPTGDLIIIWAESAEHVAGDPGRIIRGMATGSGLAPTATVTISSSAPGSQDAPRGTCVTTDSGFATAVAWQEGPAIKLRVLAGNDLLHDV